MVRRALHEHTRGVRVVRGYVASAASGAPKMLPTKREYSAQLVPKANSIVIPVATPMAKVAVNSLIQKLEAARSAGMPLL